MSSSLISNICDMWKARSLDDSFDKELEFCENKINLNHVLGFDPFLNDLIEYDTLNIIMELLE